jgi:hypothetical protein
MVGGTVIETILVPVQVENDPECLSFGMERAARVWINTRETQSNHECAIFVADDKVSRSVSVGDSISWHGECAYWTPKNHAFEDMPLKRIGCSGVSRPVVATGATP